LEPIVEHAPEGTVVSGIATWPGWRFVIALDESSVTVVPPPGQIVTPRIWKAMPIGYVLRLAANTWSQTALARVMERHEEAGFDLPRRPFGGSPKHSAIVAYTYRTALRRGAKPRDAVVEYFGVSEKTADRWLSEARASGALGTYLDEKRAARLEAQAPDFTQRLAEG
jgi:hypothetical protein